MYHDRSLVGSSPANARFLSLGQSFRPHLRWTTPPGAACRRKASNQLLGDVWATAGSVASRRRRLRRPFGPVGQEAGFREYRSPQPVEGEQSGSQTVTA